MMVIALRVPIAMPWASSDRQVRVHARLELAGGGAARSRRRSRRGAYTLGGAALCPPGSFVRARACRRAVPRRCRPPARRPRPGLRVGIGSFGSICGSSIATTAWPRWLSVDEAFGYDDQLAAGTVAGAGARHRHPPSTIAGSAASSPDQYGSSSGGVCPASSAPSCSSSPSSTRPGDIPRGARGAPGRPGPSAGAP